MTQPISTHKKPASRPLRAILPVATLIGLGIAAAKLWQQRRTSKLELRGQVVLITGASRGLGLLLAHEFADAGSHLVICAQDRAELAWAQRELAATGAEVLAVPCDVADQEQVNNVVREALLTYGRVDIVVNNAGIIDVGPLQNTTLADFERTMDVMFWGMLYTTWAVLPQMRARQQGRIVNITSIGGKVSVPHLLPYSSAKFAAVGLSEGLHAELAQDGITVTTIIPGLMRTGSHLNAFFKGQHTHEFTWFSLAASLPWLALDAERAAQQIVEATQRGDAVRILSLPAQLLAYAHDLLPGTTNEMLSLINTYLLPKASLASHSVLRGRSVQEMLPPLHARLQKAFTTLGLQAAQRLHQLPEQNEIKDVQ